MRSSSRNKHRSPHCCSNARGFTLIEVLISIVILAFISLGIYQAITETYRVRETLSRDGDFYNGIRLSMYVLQRDVTMLFSPVNLLPQPSPSPSFQTVQQVQQTQIAQQQLAAQDPDLFQTFEFWEPAIDKTGVRPSRFVGTENRLSFVANSHLRVYKDSPESEFVTITYELTRDDADPESQMLVKVENTDAFTLEKRNKSPSERRYTLLHGIKKFKYRFYRKDRDEWGPSWDTDKTEFKVDSNSIYPDIVELTLDVTSGPRLNFSGRFLFRPELPLRAINPSM